MNPEQWPPQAIVGMLMLVIGPLLGLFYAAHALADELITFINERGDADALNNWRQQRLREARIKRGQCPNDGFPVYSDNKKCRHCDWEK